VLEEIIDYSVQIDYSGTADALSQNMEVGITKHYTKATGLFYTGKENSEYTKVIELDLSSVTPSIAGML